MSERQDKQLSADELNALRLKDCERYFIEWTYRILETPGLSDDPENLLNYLCEQYEAQSELNYFQTSKAGRIRTITAGFSAGHLTLADWAADTRRVLTGDFHERQKMPKQDSEFKSAARYLYPHLFKDQGQ